MKRFEQKDLAEIQIKLDRIISRLNNYGELYEFLLRIPEFSEIVSIYPSINLTRSKILVLGASAVNVDDLRTRAKKIGIDEKRLVFEVDYNKIVNFPFSKLQYSEEFSDILLGPMPHKNKGTEDYGSAIENMKQNQDKFPKVILLHNESGNLKISATAFDYAIKQTRVYLDLV
jgi:hypothetical protein